MPKILPWSYTALSDFINCPRQYCETRVTKSVKKLEGAALIWGSKVHKDFELWMKDGTPLEPALAMHEEFLQKLKDKPGDEWCEKDIALDKKAKPCHKWATDVWVRGVIDYLKIDGPRALVVDYKTGKPRSNFKQLALFSLWTFIAHPEVETVQAKFYWLQDRTTPQRVWGRADMETMWNLFIPDLVQYKEAFKTDTWQPRPSGLCNGWCPVTSCEHWKPRRK